MLKPMFHAAALMLALAAPTGAAVADSEFDACVRKLCSDTKQGDCWIKGGAQLCDRAGSSCHELEDNSAARAIRKVGKRWEMETKSGTGWVNQRWMMVSGDNC